MKIAVVTDIPFLYEKTMYLDELEKRLVERYIDCKVFVIRGSRIFEKVDAKTGIFRMINTARLLQQLCLYDLVCAQFTFPVGYILGVLTAIRLLRKPLLVHTHGNDVLTVPEINYGIRRGYIGRFLTNESWKRAARIIAVCERTKREIIESGVDHNKVNVLYNGVDETLFRKQTAIDPELQRLRKDADFIFLSIASIVSVKNHGRLVQAFNALIKKYGSQKRIKLILVGDRPGYTNVRIENNDNIIYLGKKPHFSLPRYYSIADTFLLPSLSEAHPWSVLEAMSCQLPVIASKVGGIPETLGEYRFLTDPFSINNIMEKMKEMLEIDLAERETIGKKNRAIVLEKFTLDLHVEEYARTIKEIL
jgi:teichuronic acid biosynthesis glycosyltransferase TuaC